MEIVAPDKRLMVAMVYNAAFNLGYMALSGMAYAVKDSVHIELFCVVPNGFFLMLSL